MQQTSALYKKIIAGLHTFETRVAIGDAGRLVTNTGDCITFGGTRILTDFGGAESGYAEDMLSTVSTYAATCSTNELTVGNCISREVDIKMLRPAAQVLGLSRVSVYIRAVSSSSDEHSEWLPQGVYFLDEIQEDLDEAHDLKWLNLHGFDAVLLAEQDYPAVSNLSWPAVDIDVVKEIAATLEVTIDSRTYEIMTDANEIQYPGQYSCREVLGYIAALYAGNFTTNELGELILVQFWNIPKETNHLIDSTGYAITFGGDRILV